MKTLSQKRPFERVMTMGSDMYLGPKSHWKHYLFDNSVTEISLVIKVVKDACDYRGNT